MPRRGRLFVANKPYMRIHRAPSERPVFVIQSAAKKGHKGFSQEKQSSKLDVKLILHNLTDKEKSV
jgi:hypothetical protein